MKAQYSALFFQKSSRFIYFWCFNLSSRVNSSSNEQILSTFHSVIITTAALTVHRPGGATYACLIAGILDAFYTGLPIAFLLFAVRGGTFDLGLSILKLQNPPSQFKIASSSVLSSLTTGFTAYFVLVKWLRTVAVPLEKFMFFIMISTILSGIGAILGVKLWQRLQ